MCGYIYFKTLLMVNHYFVNKVVNLKEAIWLFGNLHLTKMLQFGRQ